MDRWIPKPPPPPMGDGAFERFLSAAIAAIITIMFSWRLLDKLAEEEDGNSTSDGSEAASSRSSPATVSFTPLTSSTAFASHRESPVGARMSPSSSGRRQLPAIPTLKASQQPPSVTIGGVTYKITNLKPFIRVPVDLPLCGDTSTDAFDAEEDNEEREKGKERKRKGDALFLSYDVDNGEEISRGSPQAKESRLSESVKSNSSHGRARTTSNDGNNIDLVSPGAQSDTQSRPKVDDSNQYAKHDALPAIDGDPLMCAHQSEGYNTIVDNTNNLERVGYQEGALPVSSGTTNKAQVHSVSIVPWSVSSLQHSTPSAHNLSSGELVDSSCDDEDNDNIIHVEVDDNGGDERYLNVSEDSCGSGKDDSLGTPRLTIEDDDEYHHPYPLREVNGRIRIVGRSRDDTDVDYNSFVLHDDEDEFYITPSSITRPNQQTPGSFRSHFSDDYDDEYEDDEDDDDVRYFGRGLSLREYDVDEEMYCSTLEPIMEEDSDDISTSGSEVDRVSLGKGNAQGESSFEETTSATHFSVPSLTSAPLRYALSSSSSSLPSSFQSSPVIKRNNSLPPASAVNSSDTLLPPLSRSVGRNCDLDRTLSSRSPHLNTTSFAASTITSPTTTTAADTTVFTHVAVDSDNDGVARGAVFSHTNTNTTDKLDYRNDSLSTHLLPRSVNDDTSDTHETECSGSSRGGDGDILFDRSHLDQYKIQQQQQQQQQQQPVHSQDYYQKIRNFGSSVDGDGSEIVISDISEVTQNKNSGLFYLHSPVDTGRRQLPGKSPVTSGIRLSSGPFIDEVTDNRDALRDQERADQTFAHTFSSTIQADDYSNSESDESVQTVITRHLSSDSSSSTSNNSPVHSVTSRLSPVKSARPLSDSIVYNNTLSKGENPEASAFDRGRIVSEGGAAVSFEEERSKQIEEREGFDLRAYKSYDNLVEGLIRSQESGEEGTNWVNTSVAGDVININTPTPSDCYVSHSVDLYPDPAFCGDRVEVGEGGAPGERVGKANKAWNSISAPKNQGPEEQVARLHDRTHYRDNGSEDGTTRLVSDDKNKPGTSCSERGEGRDTHVIIKQSDNSVLESKPFYSAKSSGNFSVEDSCGAGEKENSDNNKSDNGVSLLSGVFNEEVEQSVKEHDQMDYRSGDDLGKSSFSQHHFDDRYYGHDSGDREREGETVALEEDEEYDDQNVVQTFVIPKTPESHIIETLQNVKDLLDQKSASNSRSSLYHQRNNTNKQSSNSEDGALELIDFDEECQSTCTTTLIEVTGHDAMGFHADDDEKSGYRASRNALAKTDRDLKDRMGFQLDMDEFKMEDYNTDSGWPIVRYIEKERAYVDEEGYDKAHNCTGDLSSRNEEEEEEEEESNDNFPAGGFDYPMRSGEYHPSEEDIRNVRVEPTETIYVRPSEDIYRSDDDPRMQKYDFCDDNENIPDYMRKETEFPATLEFEKSDEKQQEAVYASRQLPSHHALSSSHRPHVLQTGSSYSSQLPFHDAHSQPTQLDGVKPQRSVSVEESPVLTMPTLPSGIDRRDFSTAEDRQLSNRVFPQKIEKALNDSDERQELPRHSTLSPQGQIQQSSVSPSDSGFHAFFRGIPSLGKHEDEGYDDFVRQISEADENVPLSERDISSPSFPRPMDSAILSGNLVSPYRNSDKFVFPGTQDSASTSHKPAGLETSSPLEKENKVSKESGTTVVNPTAATASVIPTFEAKDMRGYNFGVRKSSTCSVLNDESNNVLNASFDDSEMSGTALERFDSEPGMNFSRSRSRDSMTDSPRNLSSDPTVPENSNTPTKTVHTYTPRSAPTVSTEPSLDVVPESPSPNAKEAPSPNFKEPHTSSARLHSRSPITTFSYVPVEESSLVAPVPDSFGDAAVEITSSAVPPAGLRTPAKRNSEGNTEGKWVPKEPRRKYRREDEMPPYTEAKISLRDADKKPSTSPRSSYRDLAKPADWPQIRPVLEDDGRTDDPARYGDVRPEDQRGEIGPSGQDEQENMEYDIRGEEDDEESEEEDDEEEDDDDDDDEDEDGEEEEEDEEEDEEEEENDKEEEEGKVSEREDQKDAIKDNMKHSKDRIENPLEKKEITLEASVAPPTSTPSPLGQLRNFSYSLESGEDIYPHDSSSGSPRTSPIMSSDSASALEAGQQHIPSEPNLKSPATSQSSVVTHSVISPSRLKTSSSAWAHSQFVSSSGPSKPKSLKELKKKYKPYKSILTQEPPSPTPRPAPFQLPDHLLTPSRLKVLYSRGKFLSEQNLESSGSLEGEFQSRKTALLTQQQTPGSLKERRYTPHAKLQHKYNSQEQLQRLKNMIHDSNTRRSEGALNKVHECLHDQCILSEEGRRDILDKSLSIDNLHADLFVNLHRLGSESDAGALGDAYFPETDNDLYDLTFPAQDYSSLERPASMSELRHASDYSTISGLPSEMGSQSARASTGKGRFAQRQYKKSKSLCTLETNLDDDAFAMSPTEEGMKRVPSVHELRISKSLQKLNVPDWYKQSSLSKSGSCLLKYGSSSTMSSFQFSPSLISSPCTTPSASSNVVIKTRVMTPTSARNLRSPRFPSSMSAPTTPSGDQSSRSIRLPSDKYRSQEKPKSLMPIPIVPFDKIRAMFEKEKPVDKKKPQPSVNNKENNNIMIASSAPTTKTAPPPTSSMVKKPNSLILNGRREDEDDDDTNIADLPVPKIIVSPTEPHVKSILKKSTQEKRYSDIQEAAEPEEESKNIIRPAATYPTQSAPEPMSQDVSVRCMSSPQGRPEEPANIPFIEEIQPAPQINRPSYTAVPPVKEPTDQQGILEVRDPPKKETQKKKETIPKAPTKKKGVEDTSKPTGPVPKPRGFNFFKSLRSSSSSSSEDIKESKGRKSPSSSGGGSQPRSPKRSPNSSYDSSGFPASPPRKLESPVSPMLVPPNNQDPPKSSSARDPEHLMALAAAPKVRAPAKSAQPEYAPILRPPAKISHLEDTPTIHPPSEITHLEEAPTIRSPAKTTHLEEAPVVRPPPQSAHHEEAPSIRPPEVNARLEEAPTVRPPAPVPRIEESRPTQSEPQRKPPVPSSRPPAYETNLDDTLDRIEKRLQEPERPPPPKPEKKRWIPKPKGFRSSKTPPEPTKSSPDKKKETPPDDKPGKVSDLQTKFEVNEISYEPRRLRSSRSSGLNDSMISERSEDGYGRMPYQSSERPYGDLDKSHEPRGSISSGLPRDLDEPVRRPSQDSARSVPREGRIQGRAATRDLDRSGVRSSNRSLDKAPVSDREKGWKPRNLDERPGQSDRDYDRRDVHDLERRETPREIGSGRRGDHRPPIDEGFREFEREPFRGPERREPHRSTGPREPFDADHRSSRDRGESNRDSIGSARDLDRSRKYSDRSDNTKGSIYSDDPIGNSRYVHDEEEKSQSQPRGRWQPKPRSARGTTPPSHPSDSASVPNTNGAPSPYKYPVEGSAFSSAKPNTPAGLATPPPRHRMDSASQESVEGGMKEPPKNMRGCQRRSRQVTGSRLSAKKQRYSEEETSPPWQEIGCFDEVFDDEGTIGNNSFKYTFYHDANNNNDSNYIGKSRISNSDTKSAIQTSSLKKSKQNDADHRGDLNDDRTKNTRDIYVPDDKILNNVHAIKSCNENSYNKFKDDTNINVDKNDNDASALGSAEPPRYYRYPVFAEGAEAFTHAREDPMACNINGDMVVLWKDVVISDDDECNISEGAQTKSLGDLTVDEVFNNLHQAVERQRKLKSQLEQTYGKRAFNFRSQGNRSKRKCLQSTTTAAAAVGNDSQSHANLFITHDRDGKDFVDRISTINIAAKDSMHQSGNQSVNMECQSCSANHNDTFSSHSRIAGHQTERSKGKCESSIKSPVKSHNWRSKHQSDPDLNRQFEDEDKSSCVSPGTSHTLGSKHQSNSSTARRALHQQFHPPTSTADDGGCGEHYHEQYTDFTFDHPVTFLLSCNDPLCPWNDLEKGFQTSCQCCPCCWCQTQSPVPCPKAPCPCDCYRSNSSLYQQLGSNLRPTHGDKPAAKAQCFNTFLEQNNLIRCGNVKCPRAAKFLNASYIKYLKSCHHCYTSYCSKTCRRYDWFRHKTYFCHGSLVSSVCKKVIRFCRDDEKTMNVLSKLARRGYLSQGRGCLLVGFKDLTSAREFLQEGVGCLSLRPTYVSLRELTRSKMYGGVLDTLIAMCQEYNPALKYVLNVGIGLYNGQKSLTCGKQNQHAPHQNQLSYFRSCSRCRREKTDPPFSYPCCRQDNMAAAFHSHFSHPWNRSRHKAPILQRSIKLRLHTSFIPLHEHHLTFEKHWWDEYRSSGPTLILTGVPPGSQHSDASSRRSRELCLANVQRKLRQRGVNLHQQFPGVYNALISYVSEGTHFPSQVLFPVDTKSGKVFTCFLMPEAEAELEWMQSHFLLDDLELSKDSINRSISESDSRSFS